MKDVNSFLFLISIFFQQFNNFLIIKSDMKIQKQNSFNKEFQLDNHSQILIANSSYPKIYFQTRTTKKCQKVELKNFLIKKFQKNISKKITKQKSIQFKNARIQQHLQKIRFTSLDSDQLACPICLQIMISPILFECGHFGCQKCIETMCCYQDKCFLCRKNLKIISYSECFIIKSLINTQILKHLQNPLEHYSRIADHLHWNDLKMINPKNIEEGSFIDIKCKETGKWRQGLVVQVLANSTSPKLKIKYISEQIKIEQILSIKSMRIAKHGFFSHKRFIDSINSKTIQEQCFIPQIRMSSELQSSIQFFSSDFFYLKGSEYNWTTKLATFQQPKDKQNEPQQNYIENAYDTQIYSLLNPDYLTGFNMQQLVQYF